MHSQAAPDPTIYKKYHIPKAKKKKISVKGMLESRFNARLFAGFGITKKAKKQTTKIIKLMMITSGPVSEFFSFLTLCSFTPLQLYIGGIQWPQMSTQSFYQLKKYLSLAYLLFNLNKLDKHIYK